MEKRVVISEDCKDGEKSPSGQNGHEICTGITCQCECHKKK